QIGMMGFDSKHIHGFTSTCLNTFLINARSDILLSYPVYWWAMDIKIILGIVVVVIVLAVYLFGPTVMAYYNGAIKKD
ncbi:hypothetical protein MUP51_11330, partial [Candidatus Bathyarchaeota archaeon]|nr:hypothetical protein [Candidatus Bathyarchaeota archaeon]